MALEIKKSEKKRLNDHLTTAAVLYAGLIIYIACDFGALAAIIACLVVILGWVVTVDVLCKYLIKKGFIVFIDDTNDPKWP